MAFLQTSSTPTIGTLNSGNLQTVSPAYSASLTTIQAKKSSDSSLTIQQQAENANPPPPVLIAHNEAILISYQGSSASPLIPEISQSSPSSNIPLTQIFNQCQDQNGKLNRKDYQEALTQHFEHEGFSSTEAQEKAQLILKELKGGDDCVCCLAGGAAGAGAAGFGSLCIVLLIICFIVICVKASLHSRSPATPSATTPAPVVTPPTVPLSQAHLLLLKAH